MMLERLGLGAAASKAVSHDIGPLKGQAAGRGQCGVAFEVALKDRRGFLPAEGGISPAEFDAVRSSPGP